MVRGFTGGMSQTLPWVVTVAWVHKILKMEENGMVEILVWLGHHCMNFYSD